MFQYNPYTDPRGAFARERAARARADRAQALAAGLRAGANFARREAAYDVRAKIFAARAVPGPVYIRTVGAVSPVGIGPASFEGYPGTSVCLGASGAEVAETEVWVVVDDPDGPETPMRILIGSPGAVRFAIEGNSLKWRRGGPGPLPPRYLERARRALGL